ncbi:MAG: ABC transporter permease [Spirochaetaceae bacterium]|nr:ABC transporter permease [Spirochaetaceae bacterium]
MKIKASILYATRMLLSPSQKNMSGEGSSAGKSLLGAILCIALSLVPLVVVLTVSDGMIEGITSRIVELSSYHMQVVVTGSSIVNNSLAEESFSLPDLETAEGIKELAVQLQGVPGITAAFPERQGIGLAAGAKGRTGATIRAVPPEIFAPESNFSQLFSAQSGSISLSSPRSALIGTGVAKNLGLNPGDTIRVVTMRTSPTGKVIPKITPFTVEGIVSCGYQELDSLWVFIPFDTGFSLLEGSLSTILVGLQTEDAFSDGLLETAWLVEEELPPGCRLRLWSQLNTAQYENFASTRIMLIFVMFLIVLVASVNISSALVMLAMERRREIAILKSVGATSEGIITAFLLTGFCAGGAGVVLGIPLGILCAVNVNQILAGIEKLLNIFVHFWYNLSSMFLAFLENFLSKDFARSEFVPVQLLDPAFYLEEIPVILPWTGIFIIAAGTLVLSVVVSALPSIKAGKEKPLDTLRKF